LINVLTSKELMLVLVALDKKRFNVKLIVLDSA